MVLLTVGLCLVPLRATISFKHPLTIGELEQVVDRFDLEPQMLFYVESFEGIEWGGLIGVGGNGEKDYLETYDQWLLPGRKEATKIAIKSWEDWHRKHPDLVKEVNLKQLDNARKRFEFQDIAAHMTAINTQINLPNLVQAQFHPLVKCAIPIPPLWLLGKVMGLPEFFSLECGLESSTIPYTTTY